MAYTDLGGTLHMPFSAHPHEDPLTGELHAICYDGMTQDTVWHVVVSPEGKVLSEAEWNAHKDRWLPTDEDRAYVTSLMGPAVVEPGKFANWIAPPQRGINNQPGNFEYVRFN